MTERLSPTKKKQDYLKFKKDSSEFNQLLRHTHYRIIKAKPSSQRKCSTTEFNLPVEFIANIEEFQSSNKLKPGRLKFRTRVGSALPSETRKSSLD